MKSLDIIKHKTNITSILLDIYKDDLLGSILGFKGGTAAMLFYDLPRFSVDLDFDLTRTFKKDSKELKLLIDRVTKVLSKKFVIKDQSSKFNTLFWLVSYKEGLANIKIEISTRENPFNHYEIKDFYGFKLKVLSIRDMIAHKMIATTERSSVANRDLFDIHYFFNSKYSSDINYEVIRFRTNKTTFEYYTFLRDFISKINPKSVLNGLGEVLTDSQKDWAKEKLIKDILEVLNTKKNQFLESIKYEGITEDKANSAPSTKYFFNFKINKDYEASFPIQISTRLIDILGHPTKDVVEGIFKGKIITYLETWPINEYKTRVITTHDIKTIDELSKISLNEIVIR